MGGVERALIRLEPWGRGDLALLRALVGDPAMMEHLGGPESEAKIADRHARYAYPGSRQYKIVADGEDAGWIGYWERGDELFEIGWAVLPALQGRGIARAATEQALDLARAEQTRRYVHAFPAVGNPASNAICRGLGFELLGEDEFEYPPGQIMRCNDWRFDLAA